jgi:peptide/nickel transport system substrate-binding protein
LIIILLLCSCGADNEIQSHSQPLSGTTEEPVGYEDIIKSPPSPGGTLKIASLNPKTLNPVLNGDLSADSVLRLVFEPLVAIDSALKPKPAIAESWDFSPDGLTLTLNIRHDAKWGDGRDITAGDVVFTMRAIQNAPGESLYKGCLAHITGFSALDNKTVRVTYSRPFSGALHNLTFPVIPSHNNGDFTFGSGLYRIEEFITMKHIHLVKTNNSYKGEANIDRIEVIIMRSADTPLYAFEQSIIDIAATKNINWKKLSTTRQADVTKVPSLSYEFLALNLRNPVLLNTDIRKAIAYATPKVAIADKCYAGNLFISSTVINPESWLVDNDAYAYNYNIQNARQSAANSGLTELGSITVLANADNGERSQTADIMFQSLSEIGFSVNVEKVDFDTFERRLNEGGFDIAVTGVNMSMGGELSHIIGNPGGYRGRFNFGAFREEMMEIYLHRAESAVFEADQIEAYSDIQKSFTHNLPHISLGYKANTVLAGENVYGDLSPEVNNLFANFGHLLIY